jgi:WD40 repeat protein
VTLVEGFDAIRRLAVLKKQRRSASHTAVPPHESPLTVGPTPEDDRDGSSVTYDGFVSYSHAVDGRLAPALQAGLHRFAKPWYRVRALRIFRDETSLSATPELWPSIVEALDRSRWLIVLASPEAARSTWVNDEIAHFCASESNKQRVIVVVTKDDVEGDFDWDKTAAAPPALRGSLSHEPRVVDLRWAREEADISLENAQFRDAVADVAAPLHGRPKDELHGEDVRQHRRTRRFARLAIATLVLLFAAASSAAVIAVDQRETAREQRDRAELQARLALSRQLAAQADAAGDDQFDVALLLAAQSYATMQTPEAQRSLLQTLLRNPHLVGILPGTAGATQVAFSPDGQRLAVGAKDGGVSLWSADRLEVIRTLKPQHRGVVTSLAFSGDGRRLAVGAADGRLGVWDLATGRSLAAWAVRRRITSVALDRTGSIVASVTASGRAAVRTIRGRILSAVQIPQPFIPPLQAAILADGSLVIGDKRRALTRWRSNERVRSFPSIGGLLGPPDVSAYSPGMEQFAAVWLGRPDVRTPVVFDVGKPRDRLLQGPAAALDAMAFDRDGQMLATVGEGRVVLWSVLRERALEVVLSGVPGRASALTLGSDGSRVAAAADRGVAVWDRRKSSLLRSLKARGATPGMVAPAWTGMASAAFSPSGNLLAWKLIGPAGEKIVVWRLDEVKEIARFVADRVVGFSPDETELAATSWDSGFIVLDLATGKHRRERRLPWAMNDHRRDRPTSNRLWEVDGGKGIGVSASLDGTVSLWDTHRRQPVATLRVPGVSQRPFFAFDRAAHNLAIVSDGGALTLVDLRVESWYATACRFAARTLTESERRRYVGTQTRSAAACSG